MGERMTKELTGKALFMALRSQRPPAGLIHHSDRGSQYCAYDYRVIQEQSGLKTSMSRKGNCYDNAPMESFWGTLKNESLSHYRFNNRDEAISVIREYQLRFSTIVSVVTLVWGISPRQPSGKNIIRWLLKKRINGSVRYCQYTSMFGASYRYSGAGVGYQVASVVGGGFTPFIAAALITYFAGNWHSIAIYLLAGCLISAMTALLMKDNQRS
ncbi:integrase core domain protein [Shigella flexneri 2003036]|nr:integrase core domain protein [Shigella flexneri 2003036]